MGRSKPKKIFRDTKLGNTEKQQSRIQIPQSPHQVVLISESIEPASQETLIDNPSIAGSDEELAAQSLTITTQSHPSLTAVIWRKTLEALQQKDPDKYQSLDRVINNTNNTSNNKAKALLQLEESKPESKVLLLRAKAILPNLATVRGLAMTIANVDPNKIAPYVVAGTFFVFDILLGRLSLDDQRKIRNMLLESANAINEWISFEINFIRRHPRVKHEVSELEGELPDLYKLSLRIICNLIAACDRKWLKAIGNKLLAEMVKWQEDMEKLKDHRMRWTARRKVVEETLLRHDYEAKFLEWIKDEADPEMSMGQLTDRVTSEGRHGNAAGWFLENSSYRNWSRDFHLRTHGETGSHKRVLWISGTYGTGKTTIVHRIVSELQRLADCQPPRIELLDLTAQNVDPGRSTLTLEGEGLRVVSYFCDSTKRVNRETIVRALGRKLAFIPDSDIATTASKFYEEHTQGLRSSVSIKEWEDFVIELLIRCSASYKIVLLIDALNECDPREDIDYLCIFLHRIVEGCAHVSILISSHEQLWSIERLKPHIDKVKVDDDTAPRDEIENFIEGEIHHRKNELSHTRGNNNIFFDSRFPSLLDELKKALRRGSKGMYVWIQVWLDVILPLHNPSKTIRKLDDAQQILKTMKRSSTQTHEAAKKLQPAYERLWEFGTLKGFDESRMRLFRIVSCAFDALTPIEITFMLRIGLDDKEPRYEEEITFDVVESLSSNFLTRDSKDRLHWSHDSARDFVVGFKLETSARANHTVAANIFLSVVQDRHHPIWTVSPSSSNTTTTLECLRNIGLQYIIHYGDQHCRNAAEKHSILDPIWTKFFTDVVLNDDSASSIWLESWTSRPSKANMPISVSSQPSVDSAKESYLGVSDGKITILMSHIFASLEFHPEDIAEMLVQYRQADREEPSTADTLLISLVKHTACKNQKGENGLVFAALVNHQIIPDLIDAVNCYRGDRIVLHELLGTTTNTTQQDIPHTGYNPDTPFIIMCDKLVRDKSNSVLKTAKSLLAFEDRFINDCNNRKSCQWSHVDSELKDPALVMLVKGTTQETVCELLDVHIPCEANVQTQSFLNGETALHCAAQKGYLKVVKRLVEECHASLSVLDERNRTPLEAARKELEEVTMLESIFRDGRIPPELEQVIEYLDGCDMSMYATAGR